MVERQTLNMSSYFVGQYPWEGRLVEDLASTTNAIVCGSDNEDDDREREKRRERRERIGMAYATTGRAPFILSASLKGPFDEGWKNPWLRKSVMRSIEKVSAGHGSIDIARAEGLEYAKRKREQNPMLHPAVESSVEQWLQDLPPTPTGATESSLSATDVLEDPPVAALQVSQKDYDRLAWQAQMQQANDLVTKTSRPSMKRKSEPAPWLKSAIDKRVKINSPPASSPSTALEARRTNTAHRAVPSAAATAATTALREFAQPLQTNALAFNSDLALPVNKPLCTHLQFGEQIIEQGAQKLSLAPIERLRLDKKPVPTTSKARNRTRPSKVTGKRDSAQLGETKDRPSPSRYISLGDTSTILAPGSITYIDSPDESLLLGLSQASILASLATNTVLDEEQVAIDPKMAVYDLADVQGDGLQSSEMAQKLLHHMLSVTTKMDRTVSQAAGEAKGSRELLANGTKKLRRSVDFADVDSPGFANVGRERALMRRGVSQEQQAQMMKYTSPYSNATAESKPLIVREASAPVYTKPVPNLALQAEVFELDGAQAGHDALSNEALNAPLDSDGLSVRDLYKQPFELGGVHVMPKVGDSLTYLPIEMAIASETLQIPGFATFSESEVAVLSDSTRAGTSPQFRSAINKQTLPKKLSQPSSPEQILPPCINDKDGGDDNLQDVHIGTTRLNYVRDRGLSDQSQKLDGTHLAPQYSNYKTAKAAEAAACEGNGSPTTPEIDSTESLEGNIDLKGGMGQASAGGEPTMRNRDSSLTQSPWTKGDSIPVVSEREGGGLSSVALPHALDVEKEIAVDAMNGSDKETPFSTPNEQWPIESLVRASTPEPREDTALSFADIMTPSPKPPASKHLPSLSQDESLGMNNSQHLLRNPWVQSTLESRQRKSLKRVSFGPLPDELDTDKIVDPPKRLTSPPPPDEAHRIVMEEDKFAGLLKNTPIKEARYKKVQSPSDSQRTPGIDAMANAFMAADEYKQEATSSHRTFQAATTNLKPSEDHQGESEHQTSLIPELGKEMDIGGVIEEMGSFLEGWDVDDELAKARRSGIVA